jgi:hypothetical protein
LANHFAGRFEAITAEPSAELWDEFAPVLKWVAHYLKNLMQFVLFSLRAKGIAWLEKDNKALPSFLSLPRLPALPHN